MVHGQFGEVKVRARSHKHVHPKSWWQDRCSRTPALHASRQALESTSANPAVKQVFFRDKGQ